VGATVRTECGNCGTVELPIASARVVFSARPDAPPSTVEFRCPRCGRPHVQEIGERAVRLLSEAGVTVVAAAPHREVAPAGDDARSGGPAPN
jgi:RNase P subunit RPR2